MALPVFVVSRPFAHKYQARPLVRAHEARLAQHLDAGDQEQLITLLQKLKLYDGKNIPGFTEDSVKELREIGIQPHVLICRTEVAMDDDMARKISLFCNVRPENVIEEKDVDFSIYEVPMSLTEHGLDELIVRQLGLKAGRRSEGRNQPEFNGLGESGCLRRERLGPTH